jgi:hypothetical protein
MGVFDGIMDGAGRPRPCAIIYDDVYNGGFWVMGVFCGIMDGAGRPRPYNGVVVLTASKPPRLTKPRDAKRRIFVFVSSFQGETP